MNNVLIYFEFRNDNVDYFENIKYFFELLFLVYFNIIIIKL